MGREIKNATGLLAVYGLRAFGGKNRDQDEANLSKAVYKATACGAWVKLKDDGVEIGSIVEGSDAEVGPFFLKFPFSLQEWRDTISEVEDIADFEWQKAHLEKDGEEEEEG